MPECASTNLPVCLSVAPVNEPFSWPNRIDFDQIVGNGAAIDGDEGFRAAVAAALDGARHQFLADARLALDQDRYVGCRRLLAKADHPVHGRAVRDHVLEGQKAAATARRALDLALDGLDLERVADRRLQPVGRRWLDDEIEGAVAHRRNHGLDAALGGLHDRRDVDVAFAHRLQHADAVETGHDQIEDDHRHVARARPVEDIERGRAAVDHDCRMAEPRHGGLEQPALHGIVIDYEYGTCHDWYDYARPRNSALWTILAQGSK